MKNRLKMRMNAVLIGATSLLMLSFQNCADQSFSTVDGSSSVITTDTGGPNCRDELKKITTPIEMLFVVDTSGSNKEENGGPGTDPEKLVRAGSMQRFLDTYKSKSHFRWSFTSFSNDKATTRITSDVHSKMQESIDWLKSQNDGGNTPYKEALDEAEAIVANDTDRLANTKYIVVFLSDGMPNPSISNSNLKTEVAEVVGALPNQVSLNTVYYGPNNQNASDRLKMMAQEGGGNFLDTNANGSGNLFNIDDLVLIPSVVCD